MLGCILLKFISFLATSVQRIGEYVCPIYRDLRLPKLNSFAKPRYGLRILALGSCFSSVSPYIASELHQKGVMRDGRFVGSSDKRGGGGQVR